MKLLIFYIYNYINKIFYILRINKCDIKNQIKFYFNPKENQLNEFLKSIKSFGQIFYNIFSFKKCPTNIDENRKYVLSVNQ